MIKVNQRVGRILIKKLPKGYSATIQAELEKKKITVSRSLINMVLTGQRSDKYNIIETAVLLAERFANEKAKNETQLKNKINSIPNA